MWTRPSSLSPRPTSTSRVQMAYRSGHLVRSKEGRWSSGLSKGVFAMTRIHPHRLGFTVGTFLAVWHLGWAGLVFLGWAQGLLDFVFRMHMMSQPFNITGFNLMSAVTLVVLTGVLGYVVGWLLATIMNAYRSRLHLASGGEAREAREARAA